jgi:hypothetical protein
MTDDWCEAEPDLESCLCTTTLMDAIMPRTESESKLTSYKTKLSNISDSLALPHSVSMTETVSDLESSVQTGTIMDTSMPMTESESKLDRSDYMVTHFTGKC